MYDAIIIGGRCGGAPLAMRLARAGHRVLVLERTRFPSDTLSTHQLQSAGLARLQRWGLLPTLEATGVPRIRAFSIDNGAFELRAAPPPLHGIDWIVAPRRAVLDTLLLDAAAGAGAEVRQGCRVEELIVERGRVLGIRGRDPGGRPVEERARLVIGADGMNSLVARTVKALTYDERPTLSCAYYGYFHGLPASDVAEFHMRPGMAAMSWPTHDGLTVLCVQRPGGDFDTFRRNVTANFWGTVRAISPAVHERWREGAMEGRLAGCGHMPNFFRRPWGAGWALVGDAGYHRDPTLGQGMSDAFRDADLLADALDAGFTGVVPMNTALAAYERERNAAARPMYDLVCRLAPLAAPPPAIAALHEALRTDDVERSRFFGVITGAVPVGEFYAEANLRRIVERRETAVAA